MPSLLPTALLLALQAATSIADSTSSKRGLCYVTPKKDSDNDYWNDASNDMTWYYNYEDSPTSAINSTKLPFVPMLWGAPESTTDTTFLNAVKSLISSGEKIEYILTFNEPDGCSDGGSCVDATTAAQVWKTDVEPLKELGVKLGAPAVTGAPTGFTWLQNFFTACAGGCSADFIPVHWYGNFEGFASHIGQVNATYPNMTTWVTEFGYPDQNEKTTLEFYNQSVNFLDSLSYVTHYSWFGAFRSSASNVGGNAAMLNKKGKLTDLGKEYLGESSGAVRLVRSAGLAVVVVAACFWGLA